MVSTVFNKQDTSIKGTGNFVITFGSFGTGWAKIGTVFNRDTITGFIESSREGTGFTSVLGRGNNVIRSVFFEGETITFGPVGLNINTWFRTSINLSWGTGNIPRVTIVVRTVKPRGNFWFGDFVGNDGSSSGTIWGTGTRTSNVDSLTVCWGTTGTLSGVVKRRAFFSITGSSSGDGSSSVCGITAGAGSASGPGAPVRNSTINGTTTSVTREGLLIGSRARFTTIDSRLVLSTSSDDSSTSTGARARSPLAPLGPLTVTWGTFTSIRNVTGSSGRSTFVFLTSIGQSRARSVIKDTSTTSTIQGVNTGRLVTVITSSWARGANILVSWDTSFLGLITSVRGHTDGERTLGCVQPLTMGFASVRTENTFIHGAKECINTIGWAVTFWTPSRTVFTGSRSTSLS